MFKKVLMVGLCICILGACSSKIDEIEPPLEYEMKEEYIEYSTEEGFVYYYNEFEYPYFEGDSITATKLNTRYEDTVDKLKSLKLEHNQIGDVDEYCGIGCLPFYNNFVAKVTYNENGYISIYEVKSNWSGGGHSYSDTSSITLSLQDGNELTSDSFFVGKTSEIQELVAYYEEQENVYNVLFSEYTPYTLMKDGIKFYVWQGDAFMPLEITIPYTDENTCLISAKKALKQVYNQ